MSPLSLAYAAARHGARVALVQGERRWSFEALLELAEARARGWRGADHLAPGQVLGLSARATLDDLAGIYAALTYERPLVLFHPRLTAAERAALAARVPGLLDLDTGHLHPGRLPPALADAAQGEERPAALFFTSGTSGVPKLAVLSRRAFVQAAAMSEANLGWRASDRWLLSIPPAHVGGLSILTRCLLAGRPVVLPDEPSPFDPAAMLRVIERREVSLVSLVPTMLEALVELGHRPPPSLRAVLVGGAPLSPRSRARAEAAGWPLAVTYGLTEACSQVASTAPGGEAGAPAPGVGRPLPGVELELRAGAIWIRGPNLFSGYLEGERLIAPFDAGGWFETGDLGRLDAAGHLHVEARRTDLILSGGENIYPAELERLLLEQPGVLEALVVGVPDPRWGEVPAALLRVSPSFDEGSARRALESRLAAYKRPKHWILVDELPLGAIGKPDRGAARALVSRLARDASQGTSPLVSG